MEESLGIPFRDEKASSSQNNLKQQESLVDRRSNALKRSPLAEIFS